MGGGNVNCLKYKYPKEKSEPLSDKAKAMLSAVIWSELITARGQIDHKTSQESEKTSTIWERGKTK